MTREVDTFKTITSSDKRNWLAAHGKIYGPTVNSYRKIPNKIYPNMEILNIAKWVLIQIYIFILPPIHPHGENQRW